MDKTDLYNYCTRCGESFDDHESDHVSQIEGPPMCDACYEAVAYDIVERL